MNRIHIGVTCAVLMLLAQPAIAQDTGVGTPVIAPPILQNDASGNVQMVPGVAGPVPVAPQPPQQQAPVVPSNQTPRPPAPQAAPAAEAPAAAAAQPVAPTADSRTPATTKFSDWNMECFEPAAEGLACQATHRVIAGEGAQVVMVFSVASAGNDAANVQIALPLGISLQAGIQLVVGTGYQANIPLSRCTPQGCLVEGKASAELLAALRRERAGTVLVRNEKGEPIELPFSLIGFTDAYAGEMLKKNAS